jgi:hypothetical protein
VGVGRIDAADRIIVLDTGSASGYRSRTDSIRLKDPS